MGGERGVVREMEKRNVEGLLCNICAFDGAGSYVLDIADASSAHSRWMDCGRIDKL